MVTSEVLKDEIEAILDLFKKEKVKSLEEVAIEIIEIDDTIINKAKYFETFNIGAYDALHLACAEKCADIFLTVDKKLLKKVYKINEFNVKVLNPIEFLEEFYESKD